MLPTSTSTKSGLDLFLKLIYEGTKEECLVRRICGRRRVPAAYQVHDTRRFR